MREKLFNLQFHAEPAKIETRLEVKNEAGTGAAELYLYGTIRKAYPWEDEGACISAQGVLNKLQGLKGKDVNVHINSGGGDAFEGIAIRNSLIQHEGEINIYVDALAGSAASVVATAGKQVFMFKNCMQFVHNAAASTFGNAKEHRKRADDLDKISESARESYKSKFVGTDEELEQLLDIETWLTAKECLAFGFCTEILDDPAKEEPEPQNNVKESLFAKYQVKAPGTPPGESVKEMLFKKFTKSE